MRGSWTLLVWVAACFAPSPPTGSPCAAENQCPRPLVCSELTSTCELANHVVDSGFDVGDAAIVIDAFITDGCTPGQEICGNGIDEDCDTIDPVCAANDVAGGAINVTAGGMFIGDALAARDDVAANGCGGDGGRDLFYRVNLNSRQVFYFDTFGSAFDSVIRVYAKPCAMVGTGAGATACQDDACGGDQSQVAVSLPAGESCIVIDQVEASQTEGGATLRVVPGGRDGSPLAAGMQTNTGDTCGSTNITDPLDQNCDGPGADGKDRAYFFTTCPGQTLRLDADTCNGATNFDSVLYVKRVGGTQLGCNDDGCGSANATITDVPISNSTLYFLYVDGFDATFCGPYQLDTNLRP